MTGERLAWQRSFEPHHEDYTAFGSDRISYARVFFNITATRAAYRWSWAVSVKFQFNETGSAEHLQDAVDQATASYWQKVAKAEARAADRLAAQPPGHPGTEPGSDWP